MPPPPYVSYSPPYSAPLDELPDYQASLQFHGLALVKTEFTTPYQINSSSRKWTPVLLELNSTQLNMHKLQLGSALESAIVGVYFHSNCLLDMVQKMSLEMDMCRSLTLSESSDPMARLDDIFAADAYAGTDPERALHEFLKSSKSSKMKNLFGDKKLARSLKNIKDHQAVLGENRMLFEPSASREHFDLLMEKFHGSLIASYTLDNIKVGEAPALDRLVKAMHKEDFSFSSASYSSLIKYKNTLRLRIECKQILFQFWSFFGTVSWYRNLVIGRDLCKPLECRTLTKLKSIPNRYTTRNNALLAATAAAYESTSKVSSDSSSSLSSRRSSVFSQTPSDSSSSLVLDETVTVNDCTLVCYEGWYTSIEKHYISNCVPDLNSFDKWCGYNLTLLNLSMDVCKNKDVLVTPNELNSMVASYDKNPKTSGLCRKFLIHENGLVAVAVNM